VTVEISSHEDAYLAVGDAFRAARRQLEDHVRRQQSIRRAPTP
jgi:hypothetical protein